MFEFSVPLKQAGEKQGFFSFKVGYGGTLLAGSRHGSVSPGTSHLLVKALAHFSETPETALPGALFSIWHNLSGAALAAWWSRRPPGEREK